jgi:hypothetical protein
LGNTPFTFDDTDSLRLRRRTLQEGEAKMEGRVSKVKIKPISTLTAAVSERRYSIKSAQYGTVNTGHAVVGLRNLFQ